MDLETIKKCDAALGHATEVLARVATNDETFWKLCRANFVIGWLKIALMGLGMAAEEAEAQIAQAEAEHRRIFEAWEAPNGQS